MKTVDEILAIIDTGLQTAGDDAYGNDWPHTCWRCGEPSEDLCESCRSVLAYEEAAGTGWTILIDLSLDRFVQALDALVPNFADMPLDMRRALAQGIYDDLPAIPQSPSEGATQ